MNHGRIDRSNRLAGRQYRHRNIDLTLAHLSNLTKQPHAFACVSSSPPESSPRPYVKYADCTDGIANSRFYMSI